MKKIALFLLFWLLILGVSCKSKQPVINNIDNKSTDLYVKDTQTKVVEKTKAINDSLIVAISKISLDNKQCQEDCQKQVDALLNKINSFHSSGDNSSKVVYDTVHKTINVYNHVGATQSSDAKAKHDSIIIQKVYLKKDVPVAIPFTKEQTFNLWTGRIFWLALIVYLAISIYKKINFKGIPV